MRVYFILSLLFFWSSTRGQNNLGTVNGKITSGGKPVEFANVGLKESGWGSSTNKNGFFTIKNIPFGKYELRVSAIGYEKFVKIITVMDTTVIFIHATIKETSSQLGEVVISGTLKETFTSLSPIKVEVYTPVHFKKNPSNSVFESLQMVNGVQPQLNCNVCNTGDIHINGMEGPYTMITIDGMPIVSGLSTVYGLNGIPNNLIQRIEIVKGPASTLYGSEAVGGLINIITKNPANVPIISSDFFATSHGEYNTDLSIKTKVGKSYSLIGVNYFNFKNKMDVNHDNFTDVTLQDRISVFNKWSFDRKNNRVANVAVRYIYEDRFGGEMQWNSKFRGTDSIYGESIYTSRYELISSYQLPIEKEKITLQFSYNNHLQNSYYGNIFFKARQNVLFSQLLWDKHFSSLNDFMFGIPIRYVYYDDNSIGTLMKNGMNKPQQTYLPGIFAQDEIKISEKFTLLTGLRYDFNTNHGNIFSPRLSLKFSPDSLNTIRLSGGNGYRVVNLFTEDHAALTGAREVIVKNELNPEQSYNVNINYQKFILHDGGFIGLDVSLFYTYFTNKIVGDFFTNDQQIIYDNLEGYAVSKGLTLNTDFSFTSSLKIIAGATWMDVYSIEKNESEKFVKKNQVYAPSFSGNFTISYTFQKIGCSIDYTGKINSPMPLPVVENDSRPAHSPWFTIQNIQLTKKLRYGIEVYGGVKNIFNFMPKENVILRSFDPFNKHIQENNPNGYIFDPNYIYAPVQGIRGFLGVRWNWDK